MICASLVLWPWQQDTNAGGDTNLLPGGSVRLHALDYVLWVAAPCLQAFVLFCMHKRGLAAQLPFFYAYTIFQVVTDVYLLIVDHFSYVTYFYSYWIVTALTVLFTFAIFLELFRLAFRYFAAIRNVGTAVFCWGVLLVFVAALLTALRQNTSFGGVIESILIADRSARLMLCLLAVLLLLGARHLGISRRSILYGIAMGFVVYMLAKVVLDSVALMHLASGPIVRHLSSVFYLSACALWLIYAACADNLPDSVNEQWPTDRFPDGQHLIDQINSIVEESMRNAHKTT
jgi:hypothetical protein